MRSLQVDPAHASADACWASTEYDNGDQEPARLNCMHLGGRAVVRRALDGGIVAAGTLEHSSIMEASRVTSSRWGRLNTTSPDQVA